MTSKNPKPLTRPRPGEPNYGKFCAQPGSLPVTDLPMQPSLKEQMGVPIIDLKDIPLGIQFPQLPEDATMHERLQRDEAMLAWINGSNA